MSDNECRGPICIVSNLPSLLTPGPRGRNDGANPEGGGWVAQVRSYLGIGDSGMDWIGTVSASALIIPTTPSTAIQRLIVDWVARSVDERDMAAVRRIVRYVVDHPGAIVDNAAAMGLSAIRATQRQVSSSDLRQLAQRFAVAETVLLGVFAAGVAWGFVKSIYEAIEGVIDIVTDLEGFIDDCLQFLETILAPGNEAACREIGTRLGDTAAGRIREIANENYFYAAFHLGESLAPIIVGILLAFITAGAAAAALASTRFGRWALAVIRRIRGRLRIGRRRPHVRLKPGINERDALEYADDLMDGAAAGRRRGNLADDLAPNAPRPRTTVLPANPQLTARQMGDFLRHIWEKTPELPRLARARRLSGANKRREVLSILQDWERRRGMSVRFVDDHSIPAGGVGGRNRANIDGGIMNMERSLLDEPDVLWQEAAHEIGYDALHARRSPAIRLGESGPSALNFIDMACQEGLENVLNIFQ